MIFFLGTSLTPQNYSFLFKLANNDKKKLQNDKKTETLYFCRRTMSQIKMNEQQNIIIYRTADGRASVALYAKDGKIWLNQQQMAELFANSMLKTQTQRT